MSDRAPRDYAIERIVLTEHDGRRTLVERMWAEAARLDAAYAQQAARHRVADSAVSIAAQIAISQMLTAAILGAKDSDK